MKAWLRWGCLGIAGMIGVFAVLTGFMFLSAWRNVGRERIEPAALTQEIPAPEQPAEADAPPPAGKIVVDFEVGELYVEPGPPGSPIRVEGEYDTNSYELAQELEQEADGTWKYRIRFRESGFFRDSGLRVVFGGAHPVVRVFIPPDLPVALESVSAKGSCTMELGGLWLTEVEIHHEKGPLEVRFREPTFEPVERLKIRGKQGPTEVRRVGNASPRVANIRGSMGPTEVDLRGAWVRDADVAIRGSMGPTEVRLPRTARVEGSGAGRVKPPAEADAPIPTVHLLVRGWLGPTQFD